VPFTLDNEKVSIVSPPDTPADDGSAWKVHTMAEAFSASWPLSEDMYIPPWPGLTLSDVTHSRHFGAIPYPFNAQIQHAFCVARSGIYHLFRALKLKPGETVLMPDYHSGNEVAAVRAAGAKIIFYPILRNLEPDLERLSQLAAEGPRVIYVIHYLGWPQPMQEIQALCRQSGAILVEDCALSLLSEHQGMPLGSSGDYSVFCLYKTLPVPNGGLLVQNNGALPRLTDLAMEPCPLVTSVGRTAELALEAWRSRWNFAGKTLFSLKQLAGRGLRSAEVRSVPVGDIGWDVANVNVAMSPLGHRVIRSVDLAAVRRKRRDNFLTLREKLRGKVTLLRADLDPGMCPLFFPILVRDKHTVAEAFRKRGIQAVEFWNDPMKDVDIGPAARYLRAHVLELPIHQGVTPRQIEYIAREVGRLKPEAAPLQVP
jgi:perosamine synthetase